MASGGWVEAAVGRETIPAGPVGAWYAAMRPEIDDADPFTAAVRGGTVAPSPGLAFLAGYQAALRVVWPDAPRTLGAFAVTERRSTRPADMGTVCDDGPAGADALVTGTKDFVTGGTDAAWAIVAARHGQIAPSGRAPLVAVVVDMSSESVAVQELPPVGILSDVPHARCVLDAAPGTLLPGDGYADHVKPFRTIEDVHVGAALTAWWIATGLRSGADRGLLERLLAQVAAFDAVAAADPRDPRTHLALGGVHRQQEALLVEVDAMLASTEDAAVWSRDRAILAVARGAREARLRAAWRTLSHP